jgi:CHAT domain-containing protein/tetratricopeptide (TPR) repeat protein
MLNSQSDQQPTATAQLGWAPVRAIPASFSTRVIKAEAEAAQWHLQDKMESLESWVNSWEEIRDDESFQTAPLHFQIDALNRLGIAYRTRASTLKNENDFHHADDCFRRGLDLIKSPSPDQAKLYFNVGDLRLFRYQQTGSMDDLREGINFIYQALAVASPADPYLLLYHDGLGRALTDRYNKVGNLSDLEEAILQGEDMLRVITPRSEEAALYLNHLAPRYRQRYLRTDSIADLNRSIELLELALEYTRDERYRPYRLTNLGNALLSRSKALGQLDDLNRALDVHQKAVELTPEDDRNYALRLNNLGTSLQNKFAITGGLADIDLTIGVYGRAVEFTLPSDPFLCSRLYNFANSLRDRYTKTQEPSDLKRAVDSYRKACVLGMETSLEWVLESAKAWGSWAMRRRKWREAKEAFGYGLEAIDELYDAQLISSHRESWLRQARDLAELAAYVLARIQEYSTAISVLEQNRARALSDTLDYQEMVLKNLSIADQRDLLSLRKRIQQLEVEVIDSRRSEEQDVRSQMEKLREARSELSELLAQIQLKSPGLQAQGLDTPEIIELVESLKKPLVYLLTTFAGSLALIIHPSWGRKLEKQRSIACIWMDQFTGGHLNELLFDREGSQRYLHGMALGEVSILKNVLQGMWPALQPLMLPIANKLLRAGFSRAVLIPTGLLSLLPLHAILLEKINFSYVPSARALKSILFDQDHAAFPPALLGVGNPTTSGQAPLRFANIEIEEIEAVFRAKDLQSSSLLEGSAQRAVVAACLPGYTYLHFACHGQFDILNPKDSTIYLSGGDKLTLGDILQGEFDVSTARLITLSACQTGIIDFQNVPDEAVGFPGGLIQASVPGILSTLWPVDDVCTALLMIRFYRNHIELSMEPSLALQEAQTWLRNTTAEEMQLASYYEKWAQRDPYAFRVMRYLLKHPSLKPFDHPYYWAAFTFTGV